GLSHDITLPDGMVLRSRPLRPDDAAALLELGRRTGTHDIRLRFHGVVRVDDALGAARLSQLDYDREMAFGAFDQAHTLAGVARLHFDPQIENGEFAVLVRTDMQQRGLGRALLQDVLRYARERGAKHIYGDILSENTAMLALARSQPRPPRGDRRRR
ncbi:MAG TPA: GNAT family N-acetyltransferase, partial [Burkholderiaceae bacterium]|nr:GNAT family N-acetyltransferase [Burkholderiaceae bacterium]